MPREARDKVFEAVQGGRNAPKVGPNPQKPTTSNANFVLRPNSAITVISAAEPSSPDPGEGRHRGCLGGALRFDGGKFAQYFRGKAQKLAGFLRIGKQPAVPNYAAQILAPRAHGSGSGIDWEEYVSLPTKDGVVRVSKADYDNEQLNKDPKLDKKRKEFKGKKELKEAKLIMAATQTKKSAVAWQVMDKHAGKSLRPPSRYAQQYDEQYRPSTPATHRPNTSAARPNTSAKYRPHTSADLRPMSSDCSLHDTASGTSSDFVCTCRPQTPGKIFNPYNHVRSRFRDLPTIDFGNQRQQMDRIEDKEDRAAGVLIQGDMDRVRKNRRRRNRIAQVAENQRKAFEAKPEFGEKRQIEINNLRAAIANNNVRLPENAPAVIAAQGYVWGNWIHTNEFPLDDPDERALSRLAAEIDWIEEDLKQ